MVKMVFCPILLKAHIMFLMNLIGITERSWLGKMSFNR